MLSIPDPELLLGILLVMLSSVEKLSWGWGVVFVHCAGHNRVFASGGW